MFSVDTDDRGILSGIDCFALDLDGTVYLGDRWIDGALEFLEKVEKTGRRYCFLTNNSSRSADVYFEKLHRMGLEITERQLVTSAHATIEYLKREFPGRKVYLLGNDSLKQEFAAAGIEAVEDGAEVAVTAFDTTLTYEKLCRICDYVRDGLPFVATHPDYNCPTETGFIPDIGSFHALIEASTGRRPDIVIGKPNGEMIDYMLRFTGSARERTAVVGDRLYTDVASGVNNGLTGILVLSGEAGLKDITPDGVQPTLIFTSVKAMIPYL